MDRSPSGSGARRTENQLAVAAAAFPFQGEAEGRQLEWQGAAAA